jgi:uncharacterized integral membrane protein
MGIRNHPLKKEEEGNMNIRLILLLVITGITVLFITQNVSVVEVTFLFWSISMSRALLIFFTLALGFVLGWFVHGYLVHRRSKDESSKDIGPSAE